MSVLSNDSAPPIGRPFNGTSNTFTDAPRLNRGLLAGSLRLLFWLFFHPSAWRHHVTAVEPSLPPTFCLAQLNRSHWRSPALRRLLAQVYLGWLPAAALLIVLILSAADVHPDYIAFGLTSGIVLGLVINVTIGTAVSVAYGLAGAAMMTLIAGPLSGMLIATAHGFPGHLGSQFLFTARGVPDILTGLSIGTIIPAIGSGAAYGAVSGVALSLGRSRHIYSPSRQIGGIVIGTLIGGVIYGLINSLPFITINNAAGYQTAIIISGLIFGFTSSLTVGWRTGRWRLSLLLGVLFCLLVLTSGLLVSRPLVQISALHISCRLLNCQSYAAIYYAGISLVLVTVVASSSASYALSYSLGERTAGPLAGAVAGFLGVGGVIAALFTTFDPSAPACRYPPTCLPPTFLTLLLVALAATFGSALLLLTWSWWRPLLQYPFNAAWNLWLYRRDQQRWNNRRQAAARQGHSLLRWHSAFWDEQQRLPLLGLDEYLVWVTERYPVEGQAAMAYLATGHQRWAAGQAQIELDARHLERYTQNVKAIGEVHRHLAGGELSGPASTLLRSFGRHSQDIDAALNQATAYHKRLALRGVEDRLNNLLRELTRSNEPYAARFYPVAAGWHQAIVNYRHKLAETAELYQEIDNPYIFGVPLTEEQEIFVGRFDITARIEQLLLDPRRPPLLLYGQRRMGKTSLLRNLGRLLPSTIVPLFIDGEGLAGAGSYPDFLYNMAWQMRKSAAQQRELRLPPMERAKLEANPFTAFVQWLTAVAECLDEQGQRQALLLLDEFEAVDSVLEKGRFDADDVMRMLRHLIQHHPNFKVLLAGSHTLAEFRRWASYLINVQVVKVGYLAEQEAQQLILQPVQGFPLHYEEDACRRVLALTQGHPHLIQLLCYEIVTLKNEQQPAERRLASLADVETAVSRALETGSFFFADIEQNQADEAGTAVLHFIARQGEGAVASDEQLEAAFSPGVRRSINALLERDLLEAANGGYRFQVELIRHWFDQDT